MSNKNSPKNKEEYEWGKHPNSIKALEQNQFKKGISGNQLGRPFKYQGLQKALDKIGDEVVADTNYFCGKENISKREIVLNRIWDKAMKGDLSFVKLLGSLGCLENKEQ